MTTWLEADGTSAVATTPDSAGLSIVGDIDLRIRARAVDWSPLSGRVLMAKRHAVDSATGEWLWIIEDVASSGTRMSRLRWWDAAGTTFTHVTTTRHPGVNNDWLSLRVTMDVDNGSGSRVVTFYYSTSDDLTGATWTQWNQFTTAGTTDVRGTAATLVEIGSQQSGTDWQWVGGVAKVEIRDGIGGSLVASPDFTNLSAGAASVVDAQGNTWTFGSGVLIQGLAQKLYPAAIVETNSWTGAATDIDEPGAPNDADRVISPSSPTTAQPIVIGSQPGVDPGVHTGHQVTIRVRRNVASGSPTVTLTPVWRTGYVSPSNRGSVVKTGSPITLTDAFVDYTVTLSEAEAAIIPAGEYASGLFLELIPEQT